MASQKSSSSNSSQSRNLLETTITILVVDDDATCLTIVAAILRTFKYKVVTVKHAADALSKLRMEGDAAFDLVVSDVHMPDMNGFELQQAIFEEFNLPVVLMSADDKEGVAEKGLDSGASSFLKKPVSRNAVKDLWKLAVSTKNKAPALIEDAEGKTNSEEIAGSASTGSQNEGKRKSSREDQTADGIATDDSSETSSQKKPKLLWDNALHNKFLAAIHNIGLDRAVPKRILEEMKVPGLTRVNIASHLQKYRIFLRKVSDVTCKYENAPNLGPPATTAGPVLPSAGFRQPGSVINSNIPNPWGNPSFTSTNIHELLSGISTPNVPFLTPSTSSGNQSNYVGFNMPNIQQHPTTVWPQDDQTNNEVQNITTASPDESDIFDIDKILQRIGDFTPGPSFHQLDTNAVGEEFPCMTEDFQMPLPQNTTNPLQEDTAQLNTTNPFQEDTAQLNTTNPFQEDIDQAFAFSPLDLDNLDVMFPDPQPLEEGGMNSVAFASDAPNEAQTYEVATGLSSELVFATAHDTNFILSFDQTTSQESHEYLSTSTGFGISFQLPDSASGFVPPTQEGHEYLSTSTGFGISSQLLDNASGFVHPTQLESHEYRSTSTGFSISSQLLDSASGFVPPIQLPSSASASIPPTQQETHEYLSTSTLFGISSQLPDIANASVPPTQESNEHLSTSTVYGISSHLPDSASASASIPPTQYEDDGILESLLALYDKNPTLDGI